MFHINTLFSSLTRSPPILSHINHIEQPSNHIRHLGHDLSIEPTERVFARDPQEYYSQPRDLRVEFGAKPGVLGFGGGKFPLGVVEDLEHGPDSYGHLGLVG